MVEYYEHLYNELSKGAIPLRRFLKIMPSDPRTDPELYSNLAELIFNSQKTIYLERSPMVLGEAYKWLYYTVRGTPDEKLRMYEDKLREQAVSQRLRDESFARQ